ncbi:MAG: hypothetical protein QXM12_07325, partial [Nitrososphaerota archaeon]
MRPIFLFVIIAVCWCLIQPVGAIGPEQVARVVVGASTFVPNSAWCYKVYNTDKVTYICPPKDPVGYIATSIGKKVTPVPLSSAQVETVLGYVSDTISKNGGTWADTRYYTYTVTFRVVSVSPATQIYKGYLAPLSGSITFYLKSEINYDCYKVLSPYYVRVTDMQNRLVFESYYIDRCGGYITLPVGIYNISVTLRGAYAPTYTLVITPQDYMFSPLSELTIYPEVSEKYIADEPKACSAYGTYLVRMTATKWEPRSCCVPDRNVYPTQLYMSKTIGAHTFPVYYYGLDKDYPTTSCGYKGTCIIIEPNVEYNLIYLTTYGTIGTGVIDEKSYIGIMGQKEIVRGHKKYPSNVRYDVSIQPANSTFPLLQSDIPV